MAWIGGVAGAAGAVTAGTKKRNGKASCIYFISIVIALIAFVIVVSLYSN